MDIGNPRDWRRYEDGLCTTCWASCCHLMPVEVTAEDLVRLEIVSADELRNAPSKTAKRLKAAGYIKSYRVRTGLFVLEQKANGDCRFLGSDRKCTVYDKRPSVCREFPKIGPRPGFCPYLKLDSIRR